MTCMIGTDVLLFPLATVLFLTSTFSVIVGRMMNSYSEVSERESSELKRKISEIKKTIKEVKLRFASGKIDDDTFSVAIQEYTNRRDVLLLELEKWQKNISNQNEIIPVIIATASKIGTLWKNADLERKKKKQKLVFPEGIFWDKKKRAFLTKKRNAVFDLLDRISVSYGNEKGPSLSEAFPSQGNDTWGAEGQPLARKSRATSAPAKTAKNDGVEVTDRNSRLLIVI